MEMCLARAWVPIMPWGPADKAGGASRLRLGCGIADGLHKGKPLDLAYPSTYVELESVFKTGTFGHSVTPPRLGRAIDYEDRSILCVPPM